MKARRVRYDANAIRDLTEIRAYLTSRYGSQSAGRVVKRLRECVRRQCEIPKAGTPRPEYGENCRFVVEPPYVIYYDYDGRMLSVLRILHQSRDRDAIMRGVQEEAAPFDANV